MIKLAALAFICFSIYHFYPEQDPVKASFDLACAFTLGILALSESKS